MGLFWKVDMLVGMLCCVEVWYGLLDLLVCFVEVSCKWVFMLG